MEYQLKLLRVSLSGLYSDLRRTYQYNVGGVAMFIKNSYKISERKGLKIAYSTKVKIEHLWVEITNDDGEKHIISVIYFMIQPKMKVLRSLNNSSYLVTGGF